eukprot:847403-Prymnesium_polylepis.2
MRSIPAGPVTLDAASVRSDVPGPNTMLYPVLFVGPHSSVEFETLACRSACTAAATPAGVERSSTHASLSAYRLPPTRTPPRSVLSQRSNRSVAWRI